ncbi:MAG: hypothetical protein ABFC84_00190 [Veillonellales bacterium]
MIKFPSWLSFLHPNLTSRLVMISLFLCLIAAGNIFGVYDGWSKQDNHAVLTSLLAALLYGIPAYGLLRLKSWARLTELVLSILLSLLGVVMALFDNIGVGLFVMITHGWIAWYLQTKECKKIFKTAAS